MLWSANTWRHQMETFSSLLALCVGNSLVTCEFPTQRPVMQSFDVFFDLRLNKRMSKQSWGWWFETLSPPLWRHCNAAFSFDWHIDGFENQSSCWGRKCLTFGGTDWQMDVFENEVIEVENASSLVGLQPTTSGSMLHALTFGLSLFNSLAPGKFEGNFRYIIFKQILMVDCCGISCEIALIWMTLDFTDDMSTLVQVMAWCRQATSHYLSQCWPRSLLPYGVTRPEWVKGIYLTWNHAIIT